jgi:hypothetical protein
MINRPLLFSLLAVSAALQGAVDISVEQVARKTAFREGTAKYSDVCFSSRWPRPQNADDPHDTLRDAKAYHATRIEWCYSFDSDWIKKVKDAGFFYGGAVNSILSDQMPDGGGAVTHLSGRICDVKGRFVTAPWMSEWTPVPYWGCVNSPEYRRIYLESVKKLIDAGVDAVQTDDPAFNIAAFNWGGCFCQYCVEKAQVEFVDLKDKQQRWEFTLRSVKEFYDYVIPEIRKLDKDTVLSSNNFGGRWSFPYSVFDYGIAEYDGADPAALLALARYSADSGKRQVITYRTKSTKAYRRTIAMCYAVGLGILCPYDVYLRSTPEGSERLFIEPEKVADLFGFVRGCGKYLDGYEEAAVDMEDIEENRYEGIKPLTVKYKGVYGVVRAVPSEQNRDVVIHLVDWVNAGRPFSIELNNSSFFEGAEFNARLLVPAVYDAQAHQEASQSDDYSSLILSSEPVMARGEKITELRIPAIDPYAVVILKKIEEQSGN